MILEIIDGIFVISAGTLTIVLWVYVLLKGIGPKFIENPLERSFHIVAEFVMSIVAIIGGIALLLQQTWGLSIFFIATGLMLYAIINAIGIYGEKNKLLALILISSAIITLVLIATSLALLVF